MYYLILYILISLAAVLEIVVNDLRLRKVLLLFSYCCLLFTAGFRYETGVDWRAYASRIEHISPINAINSQADFESIFDGLDVGFNLMISLIKGFGGGVQTVFFINSFISITLLVIGLKRYVKYPVLALLLYYGMIFFYLDMSGMRQATTVAIFLYCLKYINQRKLRKYMTGMLLAFTIHWSVIVLIPLYWLLHFRISKLVTNSIVVVSLIFYFLGTKLMSLFIPFVVSVVSSAGILEKLFLYTTTESFTEPTGMNIRTVLHIVFLFITIALSFKYKARLTELNKYYPLFHRLLVMQAVLFFLFYELTEVSERLKLYFYISNIVILPSFLSLLRLSVIKLAFAFTLFLYALFYGNVHILEKPFTIAYYPYQNYLVYKFFNLKSSGNERLDQHIYNYKQLD